MNASQTRRARKGHRPRMDRASAERLLDGDLAGSAMRDDRLVRLLTAAAAPGRDRELAGEQTAVTTFTQQLSPTAGPAAPPPARSQLARLRSFKVLSLAAACSGIGVALAAATGVFSGTVPAHSGPAAVRPSATAATSVTRPTKARSGSPKRSAASGGRQAVPAAGSVPAGGGAATGVAPRLSALCTDATRTPADILSPAFASLRSTAGGAAEVPDYCAIVLGLPQLPDPDLVPSLPAAVLGQLSAVVLSGLPLSVLAKLPTADLVKLPPSVQATLPPAVLATLPAAELAKLPPSVLATLPPAALAKLPPSVLATLPPAALAKLPSSVLATLPPAALAKLPLPVLATLPPAALAKLPLSVLATLPPAALAKLPLSVLATLRRRCFPSCLPRCGPPCRHRCRPGWAWASASPLKFLRDVAGAGRLVGPCAGAAALIDVSFSHILRT